MVKVRTFKGEPGQDKESKGRRTRSRGGGRNRETEEQELVKARKTRT